MWNPCYRCFVIYILIANEENYVFDFDTTKLSPTSTSSAEIFGIVESIFKFFFYPGDDKTHAIEYLYNLKKYMRLMRGLN